MPETITQYGSGKFQSRRHTFYGASQDSYTKPPAQNPDLFTALTNVLPPSIEGILKRRWGYQLWSSNTTKFRNLYEFQRDADLARRIVGAASDGTGASSVTNLVAALNEDGTTYNSSIFVPSVGAKRVHCVNSRNYDFFSDGVSTDLKAWDGSAGTGNHSYVLSAAANASGNNTVYTGTTLSPLLPNETVTISGFTNAGNNGLFVVVSSTSTTVTVNNPNGVAESIAASLVSTSGITNWGIVRPSTAITVGPPTGGGGQSFTLSAVANASAGNTVYTGTALSTLVAGVSATIQGFVTGANNGTFTVVSSTSTTVTVNNASGVAETHAASLVTVNQARPTTLLNGWGPNAHVGSYEAGVDQGYNFGLDGGTTFAYTNPGNAFDSNPDTFAFAAPQHTHKYYGCVWSFAAGPTTSSTKLSVLSEVPVTGTDGMFVSQRSAGIWYSIDNGTTWTQVYNSPTRPKQYDIISIPDNTSYGNIQVMAFTDGHDDMYHKVYDIYLQGITTGTGPITLTSGRTYFLAFENSTKVNFSDISPASVSTNAVFGGAIPLSNLAVSSDSQVDSKVILATADGGDATILYFVAQLPNSSTTYIDSMSETALLAQNVYAFTDASGNNFGLFDNNPPPNGQFPTKHRGRVFLTDGETLYFSKNFADVITPTTTVAGRYEECFPPQNALDISAGAEIAKGLLSDGDFLYIGTDRRILRLVGDGPDNFSPPQTAFAEGGLNNVETWVHVFMDGQPLGTMWLTPDFRVIQSDFNTHTDAGSPIQDILNSINPAASTNSHAAFFAAGAYNFYVLAVPTGVNTDPDTVCVYDLKTHKWFIWRLTDSPISFLYNITFAGIPQMILWANGGLGYKFLTTLTQDRVLNTPVGFTCTATTSWLDFSEPTLRKVLNWLQVMTQDTALTMTIQGASTIADFNTPRTVANNVGLVVSPFKDLTLHLAGKTSRDRFYQLTFTSTASSLPVFLAGYDVRGFGWHAY